MRLEAREGVRERKKEREREGERERNSDWSYPVLHASIQAATMRITKRHVPG